MYKSFTFPTVTRSRVPRHWLNFVEESISELATVTNNVYDGQVAKGVRQGLGQIVLPNGDIYKGNWKSDLRHGAGLCKFGETGAIFKGEWRDGKPNGNGILFSLPNEIIEARFDGFKIIDGQVKILFTNGEYYEGNFGSTTETALEFTTTPTQTFTMVSGTTISVLAVDAFLQLEAASLTVFLSKTRPTVLLNLKIKMEKRSRPRTTKLRLLRKEFKMLERTLQALL